jgi:flagellar protein FliS
MTQEEQPMARMADVRSQYERESVVTTPERLVTMLYDRLVRDLKLGQEAIEAGARMTASDSLVHAQAIVFELLSGLDFSVGPVAQNLGQLYTWIIPQLVRANTEQDAAKVIHVRSLVEPLAAAWHTAAGECARTGAEVRAVG